MNAAVASALLLLYPILTLALRGATSALFFALVAWSCFELVRGRRSAPAPAWDGAARAYALSMASVCVAVLASQVGHWHFGWKPFDEASRFLLAIPVFLAMRRASFNPLRSLQYAFPLGALTALLMVALHPVHSAAEGDRISVGFLNVIHFGDLALVLGFLSLFSIDAEGKDRPALRLLKLLGLAAGLYLSIRSGSRGGWLAMPVLGLLWVYARWRQAFLGRALALALGIAALFVGGYFLSGMVHERFDAVASDLAALGQGNSDTSIGLRLQIWKGALLMFMRNPGFGIGFDQTLASFRSLQDAGLMSAKAVNLGNGEIHNEILGYTLRYGVPGFAAIVSVYLVPLVILLRAVRSGGPSGRAAAWMGICLIAAFFVFGLTVEILILKMTVSFYSLTLAVLLAAATRSRIGEARPS